MTTNTDAVPSIEQHDISSSAGGRAYVAEFFAKRLRRHDFGRYIAERLAADFACALAKYLSDRDAAAEAQAEAVRASYQQFLDETKNATRPYARQALIVCIAECQALSYSEDRGITVSEAESIGGVLHELRRLQNLEVEAVAIVTKSGQAEAVRVDDAFERALAELINKIDTGLDSGDLLTDAKRASAAIDTILSGGDLVACAREYFRDSGDRYEKSVEFRIGWNTCLDALGVARAARSGSDAKPTLPQAVIDALRFYAHGHHFNLDDDHQQFDTVSGEPQNWLFSERDDDCTMIEDGGVAKAVLLGGLAVFEEPTEPLEGEVFASASSAGDQEVGS